MLFCNSSLGVCCAYPWIEVIGSCLPQPFLLLIFWDRFLTGHVSWSVPASPWIPNAEAVYTPMLKLQPWGQTRLSCLCLSLSHLHIKHFAVWATVSTILILFDAQHFRIFTNPNFLLCVLPLYLLLMYSYYLYFWGCSI